MVRKSLLVGNSAGEGKLDADALLGGERMIAKGRIQLYPAICQRFHNRFKLKGIKNSGLVPSEKHSRYNGNSMDALRKGLEIFREASAKMGHLFLESLTFPSA